MTNRQLAQVGLGLIGVWALVDALKIFSTIALMGAAGPRITEMFVLAIPMALLLAFSYVLVFRSGQLVSAIAPDAQDATEHSPPDTPRVLVVLLGVWLLTQALPLMSNVILAFLAAGEYPSTGQTVMLRGSLGSVLQIAIGLFLIMKPERLLEYVRRPQPEHAV